MLHAAIASGTKQWQLQMLMLVLCSKLRNTVQHETYPFLERKAPLLSQGLEEVNIDPRKISEAVPAPHM
jgi:hypothetical protein